MKRSWSALAGIGALIGSTLAGIAMAGWAAADGHFPIYDVLFDFGLLLIVCSAILSVGYLTTRRTHTLDDAFDAGYRAGYRAGRRASGLKVVPFPTRTHEAM